MILRKSMSILWYVPGQSLPGCHRLAGTYDWFFSTPSLSNRDGVVCSFDYGLARIPIRTKNWKGILGKFCNVCIVVMSGQKAVMIISMWKVETQRSPKYSYYQLFSVFAMYWRYSGRNHVWGKAQRAVESSRYFSQAGGFAAGYHTERGQWDLLRIA